MSLRYASRVFYQSGMRVFQLAKDHVSKYEVTLKSLKDSASSSSSSSSSSSTASSSSKQVRRFSVDSGAFKATAKNERLRKSEESLRTVMFLSCWGPN